MAKFHITMRWTLLALGLLTLSGIFNVVRVYPSLSMSRNSIATADSATATAMPRIPLVISSGVGARNISAEVASAVKTEERMPTKPPSKERKNPQSNNIAVKLQKQAGGTALKGKIAIPAEMQAAGGVRVAPLIQGLGYQKSRLGGEELRRVEAMDAVPSDCPAARSGPLQGADDPRALDGIGAMYRSIFGRHIMPRSKKRLYGLDKVYVAHFTPLGKRKSAMKERLRRAFGDDIFDEDGESSHFVSFTSSFDAGNMTQEDMVAMGGGTIPDLSEGVLSLAAKHYHAYIDALLHGYNVIAIFEDDTDFLDDFGEKVQEVICALPQDGWSNVFLATPWPSVECEPVNRAICRQPGGCNGSVAYLISKSGYRTMIDFLPIVAASDMQMGKAYVANDDFITFGVNYNLAWEERVDRLSTWTEEGRKAATERNR